MLVLEASDGRGKLADNGDLASWLGCEEWMLLVIWAVDVGVFGLSEGKEGKEVDEDRSEVEV